MPFRLDYGYIRPVSPERFGKKKTCNSYIDLGMNSTKIISNFSIFLLRDQNARTCSIIFALDILTNSTKCSAENWSDDVICNWLN